MAKVQLHSETGQALPGRIFTLLLMQFEPNQVYSVYIFNFDSLLTQFEPNKVYSVYIFSFD